MSRKTSIIASGLVLAVIIFFAKQVNSSVPMLRLDKQDVYYSYLEGQRINNGTNPYGRILGSDMLNNNKKYATYFPLFYELSALSQRFGLESYDSWIEVWGKIFRLFDLAIALLLFFALAEQKMEWIGVFAAVVWLFNRWTLKTVANNNLDFIPIFFMLAALVFFPRRKNLSLLLFGISLAFKQIAIFIAPLFLVWLYISTTEPRMRLRQVLTGTAWIASVPFFTSLPFLLWNTEGLFKSIIFSATRTAETHFEAPSMDVFIGLQGLPARLPMLFLMFFVYWLAYRGIGKKYTLAFLVFAIFVNFNNVLYEGYMTWLFALLPMLLVDHIPGSFNLSISNPFSREIL
jgi:hypothetical protein